MAGGALWPGTATASSGSAEAAATKPGKKKNDYFPVYDVRSFGAVGDEVADDTAPIQAAIDAARVTGGTVYLPPGIYSISSLNMTDIGVAVTLVGEGVNASRLMPRVGNVNVIDLTGSRFVQLSNFQLGAYYQTVVPYTAVLLAQIEGQALSNAFHFENLYITGNYSVATWYVYGVPSSDAYNCDFYNYHRGPVPVVAFTFHNYASVSSDFVSITQQGSNTSDWTLTACEIHELSSQSSGGEPSGAYGLLLANTMQMRWVGGNMSSEGPWLIRLDGNNHHLDISGTTLYSELGRPPGSTFHNAGVVESMSVRSCVTQADHAVFSGDPGATYDSLVFHGKPTRSSGNATHIVDVPNGILRDSIVHCDGLQVAVATISDTTLIHPA